MIIDPVQALADLPTKTVNAAQASVSVPPIPSIRPYDLQAAGEAGKRTLWLVLLLR